LHTFLDNYSSIKYDGDNFWLLISSFYKSI